jgi:hypothetical protein
MRWPGNHAGATFCTCLRRRCKVQPPMDSSCTHWCPACSSAACASALPRRLLSGCPPLLSTSYPSQARANSCALLAESVLSGCSFRAMRLNLQAHPIGVCQPSPCVQSWRGSPATPVSARCWCCTLGQAFRHSRPLNLARIRAPAHAQGIVVVQATTPHVRGEGGVERAGATEAPASLTDVSIDQRNVVRTAGACAEASAIKGATCAAGLLRVLQRRSARTHAAAHGAVCFVRRAPGTVPGLAEAVNLRSPVLCAARDGAGYPHTAPVHRTESAGGWNGRAVAICLRSVCRGTNQTMEGMRCLRPSRTRRRSSASR